MGAAERVRRRSAGEALRGRVFMTSGEATAFVPLTAAFRQRLGADQTTPAAAGVYTMASNPLLVSVEAESPACRGERHAIVDAAAVRSGPRRLAPER